MRLRTVFNFGFAAGGRRVTLDFLATDFMRGSPWDGMRIVANPRAAATRAMHRWWLCYTSTSFAAKSLSHVISRRTEYRRPSPHREKAPAARRVPVSGGRGRG